MHPRFSAFAERLHPSFEKLLAMPAVAGTTLPTSGGIYLFSEDERHLYVGRAKNFRKRYGWHSRPGSLSNQASFAFLLAREATGNLQAGYRPGPTSRKGLMENPEFVRAFDEAKDRVRRMDYRFVEEEDPTCQALLEIYCAVALQTPYNSFATH